MLNWSSGSGRNRKFKPPMTPYDWFTAAALVGLVAMAVIVVWALHQPL